MTNPKMPELPDAYEHHCTGNGLRCFDMLGCECEMEGHGPEETPYTAGQMRAYGQACWDAARVVDEAMVERLARHLCREEWKDRCSTPEDLLEHLKYSCRYHDEARDALQAALGGDGE